jgi:hypothetical protein
MEVIGQLHAPATLPPGKRLQYQLDNSLEGSKNLSGYNVKENKIPLLPLPGIETELSSL